MVYGARFLNDNGSILGLNVFDLIGTVAVLIISSEFLRLLGLEFLAIPISLGAVIALVPVRMKYRRRIVRDTLGFLVGARLIGGHKRGRYV